MKSTFLRIVALCLSLALILGVAPMVQLFTPAAAAGATPSAKGDCGVDHAAFTLVGTEEEVKTITSNGNYKLTSDIVLTATIAITAGQHLHIDLNGHTISFPSFTLTGNTNGTTAALTICDTSADGTGALSGVGKTTVLVNLSTYGLFNFYGGKITNYDATQGGTVISDTANTDGCGPVYVNSGTAVVNMHGGVITGNTAVNGAGVYVAGGKFNMFGGTIYGNTATNAGGGVFLLAAGAQLHLQGGTITGNQSTGNSTTAKHRHGNEKTGSNYYVPSGGGGVYVAAGKAYIKSGTISLNTAKAGAGIYVATGKYYSYKTKADVSGSPLLEMTGGLVSQNTVSDTATTVAKGGGIYFSAGAFNLSGGKISLNIAYGTTNETKDKNNVNFTMRDNGEGGGVYVAGGTMTMTGGEIRENEAKGTVNVSGAVSGGGGICMGNGTVKIQGGVIADNAAFYAGGGIRKNGGTLTISGGAIKDNEANQGGGIWVNSGSFTMSGGKITNNAATVSNGGGVGLANTAGFTMTGGEISNNTAVNYGGGIAMGNRGTLSISGGVVAGNTSARGGAIFANTGLYNAVVDSNTVDQRSVVNISGGMIAGNTANTEGSVLFTNACIVNITGGLITGNKGGSERMMVLSGTDFTMSGGKISGNTNLDGTAEGLLIINNYLVNNTNYKLSKAEFSGDAVVEDPIVAAGADFGAAGRAACEVVVKDLTASASLKFKIDAEEKMAAPSMEDGVVAENGQYTCTSGQINVKYNLDLDNEIDFSFYIKKSDVAESGLTAVISHNVANGAAKTATLAQADWESVTVGSVEYWRIRYSGVAAKQMADALTLTVKNGDQVVLVDISNVKEYAELCIADPLSDEEAELMTALLNYGSAAQAYFNYNTGYLASGEAYETKLANLENPASTGMLFNLTLDSQIDFSFYVPYDENASDLTAVIAQDRAEGAEDKTVTLAQADWESVTIGEAKYWRIRYVGVAAKEMTDALTLTIEGLDVEVTFSVEDYAILSINAEDATDAEQYLMSALLEYGAAAQLFFDYNTEDLAGGVNV